MLSAFGIEHGGIAKGVRPDRAIDAAIAGAKKVRPRPVRTPLADARLGPRIAKSAFGVEHVEAMEKGLRRYLRERRQRKDRGRQTRATLEHLTTGGPNADGVWTLKPGAAEVLHHHSARHGAHTSAWPGDARSALGKSAFGIVHKGPLAAADDVALAPGKVKAVTGTVRSSVAVPASTSSPRKPLAQKLNAAVAATGGSQT